MTLIKREHFSVYLQYSRFILWPSPHIAKKLIKCKALANQAFGPVEVLMEPGGEIPKLVIPRLVLRTGPDKASHVSNSLLPDSCRPRRQTALLNNDNDNDKVISEDRFAVGPLLVAICQHFYKALEDFVETYVLIGDSYNVQRAARSDVVEKKRALLTILASQLDSWQKLQSILAWMEWLADYQPCQVLTTCCAIAN